MLSLQTGSIYFALIKELSESIEYDLSGSGASMPMLSLEIRHLKMS